MSDSPRKGSLLVIFLTVFVDLLGFGLVLPLLPIYARQFVTDTGGWQLGLLMASFSAMQFLFAPMWGRLSDRVGRRPVLMIGLLGSAVFYTLFALATEWASFHWILVARIGAGIAGATIPTAQAYIADSTSLESRPKGMALIGVAFGLGFTFGPLLGYLAVPEEHGIPGPAPGYIAAALSAVSLLLAIFLLPESRQSDSESASHPILDLAGFRLAVSTPSVGLILLAIFVCVFSFANFETTLSLLIKGAADIELSGKMPFHFTWGQVCLTFAYIGITLAFVQGGLVRRLAGRVDEGRLASFGAAAEIVGFGLVYVAIERESAGVLMGALAVVVTGFAFMQPSLNSLLSRRSDPARQGTILGVGQSVNSLARIAGSALGIPLLRVDLGAPYLVAGGLMLAGLVLVALASKHGRDFAADA